MKSDEKTSPDAPAGDLDAPYLSMHKLIEDCELAVTRSGGSKGRSPGIAGWFQHSLLVPFGLCMLPLGATWNAIVRTAVATALLFLGMHILSLVGGPPAFQGVGPALVAWVAFTLLAGLFFAPPSGVSRHSYDKDSFRAALRYSEQLRSKNSAYLQAVASCLKTHREEVGRRLAVLTWALSALWAVSLYFTGKTFDQPGPTKEVGDLLVLYFLCVAFALILQLYRGGVAAVFILAEATIQKFTLEVKTDKQ